MKLVCINDSHHSGYFSVGKVYNGKPIERAAYKGMRVRDDKNERKDFNFLNWSNSYLYKYFEEEKV